MSLSRKSLSLGTLLGCPLSGIESKLRKPCPRRGVISDTTSYESREDHGSQRMDPVLIRIMDKHGATLRRDSQSLIQSRSLQGFVCSPFFLSRCVDCGCPVLDVWCVCWGVRIAGREGYIICLFNQRSRIVIFNWGTSGQR